MIDASPVCGHHFSSILCTLKALTFIFTVPLGFPYFLIAHESHGIPNFVTFYATFSSLLKFYSRISVCISYTQHRVGTNREKQKKTRTQRHTKCRRKDFFQCPNSSIFMCRTYFFSLFSCHKMLHLCIQQTFLCNFFLICRKQIASFYFFSFLFSSFKLGTK